MGHGRIEKRRKTKEMRYYISDLLQAPGKFNSAIHEQRGIENKQHWTLDIAFGEDDTSAKVECENQMNDGWLGTIII